MNSIKVSVVTPYRNYHANRIFTDPTCLSGAHSGNQHWTAPYSALYERGRETGVFLGTSDVTPPSSAQIVLFLDPPATRSEFDRIRREAPHAKFLLMLIESPLQRQHSFFVKNHSAFDGVLTYDSSIVDGTKYFGYRLPMSEPPSYGNIPAFAQRRLACLVGTNQNAGRKAHLRKYKKVLSTGWAFPTRDALSALFHSGELYGARRELAREFAATVPGGLDIFGRGWEGYAGAKGEYSGSKLELLANYRFNICFENVENDCGYISEKIFEPMYSDTVPVYRGNKSIAKVVPRDCYIDATEFRSNADLVNYIRDCPKSDWERFISAGSEFIRSESFKAFLPKAFACDVLTAIHFVDKK